MEFWYEWFEITVPNICITSPASYYSLSRTYFFTESDVTSVVLWLQRNRATLFWSYPQKWNLLKRNPHLLWGRLGSLGWCGECWIRYREHGICPRPRLCHQLDYVLLRVSPASKVVVDTREDRSLSTTVPAQVSFFPVILFKVLVWKFYRKMNRLRTALSKAKTLYN